MPRLSRALPSCRSGTLFAQCGANAEEICAIVRFFFAAAAGGVGQLVEKHLSIIDAAS
jgi:hypothetical protein